MTLSPQLVTVITAIGSLLVPPVVSLIKQENWSAPIKQLIAGLLSLAVAAIAIAIVQPADFGLPFVSLAGLVYAGDQIVYGAYFSNSSLDAILTKLGSGRPSPRHEAGALPQDQGGNP